MRRLIHTLTSFLARDFHIATSYKFQFLFNLCGGIFLMIAFYFVSKLVSHETTLTALARYQSDYFSFVLVGIASTGFLYAGVSAFTERLRTAMTEGSLEMMLACPTSPIWVLAMPGLWNFLFEGARALVMFGVGVTFLGADLGRANLFSFAVVMSLTVTAYSVFGLLSVGLVIVLKRGDPVGWAFANASALIAGAYFPVDLLPAWMRAIAGALPMTYAYHALRMTLLTGAGLATVAKEVTLLAVFSLVGMPLAVLVCHLAVARAKRTGTLADF